MPEPSWERAVCDFCAAPAVRVLRTWEEAPDGIGALAVDACVFCLDARSPDWWMDPAVPLPAEPLAARAAAAPATHAGVPERLFSFPQGIAGQTNLDTDTCPDCKGKGRIAQWGDMARAIACGRCQGCG